MADTKISALPASTVPLAGTEVLPIVQSSTTKQVSVANLTAGRSVGGTNFIPSGSSVPTNGLYLPAANSLGFSTNSTNVATIDSGGNLGLGVTPSAWSPAGYKTLQVGGAGNSLTANNANDVYLTSNAYFDTTWKYGSTNFASSYEQVNSDHIWSIAPSGTAGNTISFTQAMTLNASGNLLVGGTSAADVNTNGGFYINPNSRNTFTVTSHLSGASSGSPYAYFYYANTDIGSITQAGTTGVLYNITSDYRLKTVVGSVTGQGARIDALEPVEYTWNSDGSQTRGFLAHKFQEVYAGSVSGTKDAVDADGKPVYQAMQAGTSEVIADLVAELQSLRIRVAQLESKA
jgi:hypothetical protein